MGQLEREGLELGEAEEVKQVVALGVVERVAVRQVVTDTVAVS